MELNRKNKNLLYGETVNYLKIDVTCKNLNLQC